MAGLNISHVSQNLSGEYLEHHFGYEPRPLPCTDDVGTCEYLDAVYASHDLGVKYTIILWAVIGGIAVTIGISHYTGRLRTKANPDASEKQNHRRNGHQRASRAAKSWLRSHLLPNASRWLFGRASRLQALIFLILLSYLTVFTFIGVAYKSWTTPVNESNEISSIRTGLAPFANRIGMLAYALLPLSILLSSRESLLSLITGIPYQNFMFLHKWLGLVIYIQSTIHTIGWVVIEGKLYQPQPWVWNYFVQRTYTIWGLVAITLVSLLVLLSCRWTIRLTGYEFFRKAHYVIAMLFVGACWGHWPKLSCWLIASLGVWAIDRGIRLIRTAFMHWTKSSESTRSLQIIQSSVRLFSDDMHGDVVRLDFQHSQRPWKIGQHFYLCFPQCSIWQSHPFTPSTVPTIDPVQSHTYIMRVRKGETAKLAGLARIKTSASEETMRPATANVILSGPYGMSTITALDKDPSTNVMCIAGGTGITFILPILQYLISKSHKGSDRKVELIWAIRRRKDMRWIQEELDKLHAATHRMDLSIQIFVTREDDIAEQTFDIDSRDPTLCGSPRTPKTAAFVTIEEEKPMASPSGTTLRKGSFSIAEAMAATTIDPIARHPDLNALVNGFVASTVRGPTCVFASGPGGMVGDLKAIVAGCNSAGKVWKGDERGDVRLVCDDRHEL
jgi:predicted ferric reductase